MLKLIETGIKDLYIIEPQIFGDNRGYFMESYNKNEFERLGLHYDFVQDNQSKSKKGVLRGLHFQRKFPQAKFVRVLEGEVFDVAVDFSVREGVELHRAQGHAQFLGDFFCQGAVGVACKQLNFFEIGNHVKFTTFLKFFISCFDVFP